MRLGLIPNEGGVTGLVRLFWKYAFSQKTNTMQKDTTGQTVLITGASSGIGYELARCFAADGHHLVLVARHQDRLDAVALELSSRYGIQATSIARDLFLPGAAEELYREVQAKGLQVDILVNDAGQGEWGEFHTTDLQRQLDIIQLNVVALTALTHLFLQDMIAKGYGKILNLASIASTSANPLLGVYAATKAYVLSFSEALHNELKDKNITVTALMPGATDTDFFNKANMEHTKAGQGSKDDPAEVAKTGYEALMSGDDKVISGMKNKIMGGMLNSVMTEEAAASMARKQMEPAEGK